MAVPVARVHLKVAHAALPALLPTPPNCKMLLLFATTPCVAAIVPKPLTKHGFADADERWNTRKIKQAFPGSSVPRSADTVKRSAGHGSSRLKNTTSPPPMRSRADSVERWDVHKKAAACPASSSPSSSSGRSSLITRSKISRATSAERWDVNKKPRPSSQADQRLDDGESSSTGSTDIDMEEEEEEEILWKPRAMYAGPGFAVAAPESSMLPMPTTLAVRVA